MSMEPEKCPKCGVKQRSLNEVCPSCGTHLGYPNVRVASSDDEQKALDKRFQEASDRLKSAGLSSELEALRIAVENNASVIVSMPVNVALNLVADTASQYVNYEKLIGSGARIPASFANDSHRKVVAGAMFGSAGDNITYGALSLSDRGLKSYGDIYCKLKAVAIDQRTSFLEMNSYDFFEKYKENCPTGYRSNWNGCPKLVVVKLEQRNEIVKGQTIADWEKVVLVCDGKNRNEDEFIEAHIYGSFNSESIEKLVAAEPLEKKINTLVETVISAFIETKDS